MKSSSSATVRDARRKPEYEDKGKLIDKTKYDEDGEPYMED